WAMAAPAATTADLAAGAQFRHGSGCGAGAPPPELTFAEHDARLTAAARTRTDFIIFSERQLKTK
ncbi:MAG: hypothetical protein WCO71_11110, partial [Pseudomonadota bacterium]